MSRRGFLDVEDGFEAKLEGRVDRDRLLDFGQIVGFQDGVSAQLADADEELVEGDGLGYLSVLEDVQDPLLGGFVVGSRTPGALPPGQHVLHPACSFPTLPAGAVAPRVARPEGAGHPTKG